MTTVIFLLYSFVKLATLIFYKTQKYGEYTTIYSFTTIVFNYFTKSTTALNFIEYYQGNTVLYIHGCIIKTIE